jgi:hypothetical protein
MSESFVDVTYRGLSLARRAKLAQVRPSTGYLEVPQPMPVGSAIAIITDDTVALDATVVEVHEQVAGSELPPGMLVRPKLDGEAAQRWWKARVTLTELEPTAKPRAFGTPPPIPVVLVQKRMTNPGIGVPQIIEDGHDTGVMDAIDPALVDEPEPAASESVPKLVDDGKKTTAMAAVDLAALGLETAVTSGDDDDGDGSGDGNGNGTSNGAKPEAKSGVRKRRKKR